MQEVELDKEMVVLVDPELSKDQDLPEVEADKETVVEAEAAEVEAAVVYLPQEAELEAEPDNAIRLT